MDFTLQTRPDLRRVGRLLLVLWTLGAAAQARADTSVVDLTYAPSQSNTLAAVGMGVYTLKDAGPGLYFNGSLSGSPDNYYAGSCYYSCGAVSSTQQGSAVFAVGATFPLVTSEMNVPFYRSLHSYVGLGYGSMSGYAQYANSSSWYDYSEKDASGVNANAGLIFGFDGFALNVGVNSLSKMLYVGIGISSDKK